MQLSAPVYSISSTVCDLKAEDLSFTSPTFMWRGNGIMPAVMCNHDNFICHDKYLILLFSLFICTKQGKASKERKLVLSELAALSCCLSVHWAFASINSIFRCRLHNALVHLELSQPTFSGIVIQKQERTTVSLHESINYCQPVGQLNIQHWSYL